VSVLCIGAGPARAEGGISRTETYMDFAFDIGGHRFLSKSGEIEALWREILGEDFLARPRKSRIHCRHRLFDDPLRPWDALSKLGPAEVALCVLSYARARLAPVPAPRSFTEWLTNKFGRRLFEIVFRTDTEKVWGARCEETSADAISWSSR